MTNKERYDSLVARIKKQYPDVKIRYKEDHWFWKRLPKMFRCSAITLSHTIWMPFRNNDFDLLAHEYQHEVDIQDMGWLAFLTMYVCPQILSLFWFFIAIIATMFGFKVFATMVAVGGAIFLLPWPSKARTYLEMKAYLMSLYVVSLIHEDQIEHFSDFVVDVLRRWLYYKMVWTEKQAREWVRSANKVLKEEEAIADTSIAFKDVNEILTKTD